MSDFSLTHNTFLLNLWVIALVENFLCRDVTEIRIPHSVFYTFLFFKVFWSMMKNKLFASKFLKRILPSLLLSYMKNKSAQRKIKFWSFLEKGWMPIRVSTLWMYNYWFSSGITQTILNLWHKKVACSGKFNLLKESLIPYISKLDWQRHIIIFF